MIVLTDHRNNLFTGSLLANRRTNKRLLRWAIDVEYWGDCVTRVWIKGKDHDLADPISRNSHDRGGYSAYELLLGHVPQCPIDAQRNEGTRFADPNTYVAALRAHLKTMHSFVSNQLAAEIEKRHDNGLHSYDFLRNFIGFNKENITS